MRRWLLVSLLALAVPRAVHASPSGLNHIPTADTAPSNTIVVQEYSTYGPAREPEHAVGFKMGLRPAGQRLEWGVDGRVGSGTAGPAVFQAKYAIQPVERGPTLAVGVASLGFTVPDRKRAGKPFAYGVLSQDLGVLRVHGGYGFQEDNDAGFVGIDRTVRLFHRPFTPRVDAIQIRDGREWLTSVGFLYGLGAWVALEAWMNAPADGTVPSATIKFDLVIPLSAVLPRGLKRP